MTTAFVPDPGEVREINFLKENTSNIGFALDMDKVCEPLRPMHGFCNFAPVQNAAQTSNTNILQMLRNMRVPYAYFHDAPLENPGWDIIDITRIFPIFKADENDPENYCFGETDTYLQQVIESNTQVIFRLGETIELTRNNNRRVRVAPPADFDKWARICINIIRHYNEGWADGFHWNIRDWSIWEEPNNPNLWAGPFEEYLRLYEVASRKIKAAFPDLRVGGPATTTLGFRFLDQFLAYCREKDLPLDFVCYTAYYHTPAEILAESFKRKELLDKYGYSDIPLWMDEWHGSPVWQSFPDPVGYLNESRRVGGFDGAVFAGTVLCGLHDTPVERACYYSVSIPGGYGIFDEYRLPTPQYYVFEKYAGMINNAERRIAVDFDCEEPNVKALAVKIKDTAKIEITVGCYLKKKRILQFKVPSGYAIESIECLDKNNPKFATLYPWEFAVDGDTVSLRKPEMPAAFFIRLAPVK